MELCSQFVNVIDSILIVGQSLGRSNPLRVNPFDLSAKYDHTVVVENLQKGNQSSVRSLVAGPGLPFIKNTYVATLKGKIFRSQIQPLVLDHQWIYQLGVNAWIVIDEPSYGFYGNLINGRVSGSDSNNRPHPSANCRFVHRPYNTSDVTGYVDILTFCCVQPYQEFILSYGSGDLSGNARLKNELKIVSKAYELSEKTLRATLCGEPVVKSPVIKSILKQRTYTAKPSAKSKVNVLGSNSISDRESVATTDSDDLPDCDAEERMLTTKLTVSSKPIGKTEKKKSKTKPENRVSNWSNSRQNKRKLRQTVLGDFPEYDPLAYDFESIGFSLAHAKHSSSSSSSSSAQAVKHTSFDVIPKTKSSSSSSSSPSSSSSSSSSSSPSSSYSKGNQGTPARSLSLKQQDVIDLRSTTSDNDSTVSEIVKPDSLLQLFDYKSDNDSTSK